MDIEKIGKDVLDSAFAIHSRFGSGLLEKAYRRLQSGSAEKKKKRSWELPIPNIYTFQLAEAPFIPVRKGVSLIVVAVCTCCVMLGLDPPSCQSGKQERIFKIAWTHRQIDCSSHFDFPPQFACHCLFFRVLR